MPPENTENKSTANPATSPWGSAETIRETTGRCNTCLAEVPARVVIRDGEARLEKNCPRHDITWELLSRDADYWQDLDRFYFQVLKDPLPQRDFLVRMTETCNLDCPICLAKANTEDTPDMDLSGLENLLSSRRRIKVDLMAAEPTIRKDLDQWIRKVKSAGHICALHTNGIKLSNLEYARSIKESGVDEVFLQFDGFDDDAIEVLRGKRLLDVKLKALANLREVGLATSLIVVIAGNLNEDQVGKTFRFALQPENDHIREVFWLGLRVLGSTRDAVLKSGSPLAQMSLMPDQTLELLCQQEPDIHRDDIRVFNKLYFSLLSTFKVKKCLYVQHYLVTRDGKGGFIPFSRLANLKRLEKAAERYAATHKKHPYLARARFLASLTRHSVNPKMVPLLLDFLQLQLLLRVGMNLDEVSRRTILLGFITACDPYNFDEQVAVNCGKGELSVDGGFVDSGAVANVRREARFDDSDLRPGHRHEKARHPSTPHPL